VRAALRAQRAQELAAAVAAGEPPPARRVGEEIGAMVGAIRDPSELPGVPGTRPEYADVSARNTPPQGAQGPAGPADHGSAQCRSGAEPTITRAGQWSRGRKRALAGAGRRGRAVVAAPNHARVQFDALRSRRPALGAAVKRALDAEGWTFRHEAGRSLLGYALTVEALAVPTVYYSRSVLRRPGARSPGRMARVGDISLWTINRRAYAARGYAQPAFARAIARPGHELEDTEVCRQTIARYARLLEQHGGIQIVRRNPAAPEWCRGSSGHVMNEYWVVDEVLRKPGLVSQWLTADGVHDTSALEQPWAGFRARKRPPAQAQPPPV